MIRITFYDDYLGVINLKLEHRPELDAIDKSFVNIETHHVVLCSRHYRLVKSIPGHSKHKLKDFLTKSVIKVDAKDYEDLVKTLLAYT